MVLKGVNTESNEATVSFTVTIVRDCSTATVVAPASYATLSPTYKINTQCGGNSICSKSVTKFSSSDAWCVAFFTYELKKDSDGVALSTTYSTVNYYWKPV